jgi:hypothetical protein
VPLLFRDLADGPRGPSNCGSRPARSFASAGPTSPTCAG